MDFRLSPEQELLRDSARRFVEKEYGFERRMALVRSDEGFSRETWRRFAELGWLGAASPTLGGGAVETAILMQEFGRNLVVEPFLSCIVLAGRAIEASGGPHRETLLPRIVAGEQQVALAHDERGARGRANFVATRAEPGGRGFRLRGRKIMALGAPSADHLVVSARTEGGPAEARGITLFLVPRDAGGLDRVDYRTIDGFRAADLALDGVEVDADAILGPVGGGLPALESAFAHAILAVSAEAIGCMEATIALTGDYLKTRKQFGVAIGSFQALQHRMAEMHVELEQSRSMLFRLIAHVDHADEGARRRAVSAAKVQIGHSALFVGAQGIQLHGGIGVTDDYAVGHYYKRLTAIEALFGNSDHHLRVFADAAA